MAGEEQGRMVEIEGMPKISKHEMEAASASGLKQIRKKGEKVYELADVALKDDAQKCQQLADFAQNMKTQGIPVLMEEKARVIAVYIRVH